MNINTFIRKQVALTSRENTIRSALVFTKYKIYCHKFILFPYIFTYSHIYL